MIAQASQRIEGVAAEFDAQQPWSRLPLAVIDFETTGVSSEHDRVIEVGVVCFRDGAVTSRESFLVQPGVPIPDASRAIHGITDEELEGAPTFAGVLPQLVDILQGHLPVAYNAPFDRGFLLAELTRHRSALAADVRLPPAMRDDVVWVDPLVWAREHLKQLKSKRLEKVAAHFEVPLTQAHRAAGDAEATGHVLMALAPKMPAVYGELVRLQARYAAFQEAEFAKWRKNRS